MRSILALFSALAAAALPGSASEPPKDVRGLPVPAWQADAELGAEWQRFTGRYIFVRACGSCHEWGPAHLDRAGWSAYLEGFPGNHEPDVREEYEDLTAQFAPGRMVPGAPEQLDALSAFLLSAAPTAPSEVTDAAWSALPEVGSPAPAFRFVDLDGREHTLSSHLGKRRLVLVLSRAYW